MTATGAARALERRVVRPLACALLSLGLAMPAGAWAQSASKTRAAKAQAVPKTGKPRKAAPSTKPAASRDEPPPLTGDPQKDQARQASERDRLTARIAELNKQIAAGEKSRSGAASALARAERALAEVNRRMDELAQRQRAAQELVATLDRQRLGTEGQIAAGQKDIARTMTMRYANRDVDPARAWLSGGDPNAGVVTDGYLDYLVRAQAGDVEGLHTRVADLQSRRQRADDDNRTLAQQADAQNAAREALASDRAAQRQSLDRLSKQIAEQRTTASALAADEQRLSRVVERLQKVIEQQAAEERARRLAAAKRLADQQAAARKSKEGKEGKPVREPPAKGRDGTPPPAVEPEPDEAPGGGAFARLRGQLRLPVRGAVTGRFGAPRGAGGATWKGLFVKADAGADVRAVAPGKVIYADDLRGFGNLLIVDHGNQYLSIYANNDALLKRAGDTVQGGDVVSRAGNSSGDDQTGLYFELRFRGRPFDPMPWIGAR